jgi:hypothetical protein
MRVDANAAGRAAALQCDVFLSHAGEQKYGIVSHLAARLREHYPELKVFVDYGMRGGDGGWEEIKQRVQNAKAGETIVKTKTRCYQACLHVQQWLFTMRRMQYSSWKLSRCCSGHLPDV